MFGKKKQEAPELDLGTEVEYLVGNKWRAGVIHSISRTDEDGVPKILSYNIDTGKTHLEGEIETPKGEDNIPYSQPVQVTVAPDKIRLAS